MPPAGLDKPGNQQSTQTLSTFIISYPYRNTFNQRHSKERPFVVDKDELVEIVLQSVVCQQ